MAKSDAKSNYVHYVPPAKRVADWYKKYNFILVTSMEQLEQVFKSSNWTSGRSFISFDTETTGLDPEELDIVGYSFCIDGMSTYYVPVNHFQYEYNLGEPSCAYIYERMCEAKKVFMYNARFDMRVMEYIGYKEHKDDFDKKHRWNYVKFDMSKVPVMDVMNAVWNSDTNIKMPSLKFCFAEGTRVFTAEGVKRIEDITCEDSVIIGSKSFNIVGTSCNGLQDVIELEFEDGYKVSCTEDHRFLVKLNGEYLWVMAKDLTAEMDIVTNTDSEFLEYINKITSI